MGNFLLEIGVKEWTEKYHVASSHIYLWLGEQKGNLDGYLNFISISIIIISHHQIPLAHHLDIGNHRHLCADSPSLLAGEEQVCHNWAQLGLIHRGGRAKS
jgi:hypothetical protein